MQCAYYYYCCCCGNFILIYYGLDFGGISQCAMLFRSNLFLMTAGGQFPKYSRNIVFMYDCLAKKFVMELNFPSPVKSVRLSRSKSVIMTLLIIITIDFYF